MNEPESIVFVVDDDPSVRRAIKRLIGSVGLQVELFGSAQEFLTSKRPNVPVALSSISGCRESVDSTSSASSPKPTFTFRSFSSLRTATSR